MLIENARTSIGILWSFSDIFRNRTTIQPGKKNNKTKDKQYLRISDPKKELPKKFNAVRITPEKTKTKSTAL
jgi:hypothetical protein